MKKLLIVFIFSATMFTISCENNPNENGENEKYYLTISYHSEGHTEGEVPVDDNRYEMEKNENYSELSSPHLYNVRIIVAETNLKKCRNTFECASPLSWIVKDSKTGNFIEEFPIFVPQPRMTLPIYEKGDAHYEFHAVYPF